MSFKPEKAKQADRGKWAEKELQNFLTVYSSSRFDFDWERLPDSRSSMGRVSAQVADFAFFYRGGHGAVEVKTLEHDSRLTRAKVTQLPKMLKRHAAGGNCFILTFHSVIKKWRRVPVQVLPAGVPSWDLSAWPTYDSAMEAMEGFC